MTAALKDERDLAHLEPLTPEQYLELEQLWETKHEYAGGYIRGMAGATERHEIAPMNVAAALHTHLRGKPCRVFKSDMKLRFEWNGNTCFYYPDVMVVCDPADDDEIYKKRPTLVVEVSSREWQRDYTEKLMMYRTLPSLEEYVVIDGHTGRQGVTIFRRADGWEPPEQLTEGEFTLRSVGLTLTVADIYR